MNKPVTGELELHVKLAGMTAVWGSLAVLAWFFPLVGFAVLLLAALISASHFITAYNIDRYSKEVPDDSDSTFTQLELFDATSNIGDVARGRATMGAEREGSVRENLSESKV